MYFIPINKLNLQGGIAAILVACGQDYNDWEIVDRTDNLSQIYYEGRVVAYDLEEAIMRYASQFFVKASVDIEAKKVILSDDLAFSFMI